MKKRPVSEEILTALSDPDKKRAASLSEIVNS
jgi:hypothetical protein